MNNILWEWTRTRRINNKECYLKYEEVKDEKKKSKRNTI